MCKFAYAFFILAIIRNNTPSCRSDRRAKHGVEEPAQFYSTDPSTALGMTHWGYYCG